ncbi:MAG: NapC/NirT family cytochrome c [Peptococcaceae bacterium]|nr:NapC/NirT family cytochrome c [Peptococcaceae bacterium]
MDQPKGQTIDEPIEALPGVKTKRKRLSGIWLIMAICFPLLIVLSGGAYGVNEVVTDSNLCVKCHEMRPEYYTWMASSHSQIKCTDCHLPTDKWGRVVTEYNGLRQIVEHFTNLVPKDIITRRPIANSVCLTCHSKNRVANLPGDLIMSHTLHDKHQVQCINCHNGVVHGKIEERGIVDEVKRTQWTAAIGKAEVLPTDTRPTMLQCLTCHRQWKVTTHCEKCHRKIPTPPTHQPGTWLVDHGQAAWQNVNQCSVCHYDSKLKDIDDKLSVAQYVRSNQFCYNCHSTFKPPSHDFMWAHDHASQVTPGEVPYCIVCHDVNKPDANSPEKGNKTYCNKCHGKYYVEGHLVPLITPYTDPELTEKSHGEQ